MDAFLLVTDKCVIHCKYCFYSTNYLKRESVFFSQQREFCEWVRKNDCKGVILTGGDPLHNDCFENTMDLIRSLSTLKCSVSIDTAFAIGNKKIRTLSRENIKNIYVSCDSHIAKIHDFQRGQSKETFAAIKVAMNVGLPIAINCTVTAKNAPTIMATYWHFRNMGVKDVTFSIAFIPEGHSLYPSLACERMNKEQKRKLANDLLAIAKQTKDISTERYARLQAICYLDAGWDRMIFDQMKCQMGKNLFVVDQAGRVKMCFHKKDILGQIGDRDSAILNRPQRTVLRNCFGKHCCSLFAIDSFWKPT